MNNAAITSRRIAPGFYRVEGTRASVEIVRVEYPNDGTYWIVTMDGQANHDPFFTKREALDAIRADPTI